MKNYEIEIQPSSEKFEVKKDEFEPKKFENERENLYHQILWNWQLTSICKYTSEEDICPGGDIVNVTGNFSDFVCANINIR